MVAVGVGAGGAVPPVGSPDEGGVGTGDGAASRSGEGDCALGVGDGIRAGAAGGTGRTGRCSGADARYPASAAAAPASPAADHVTRRSHTAAGGRRFDAPGGSAGRRSRTVIVSARAPRA
ncbi:hypothetical protein [Streptomyces sp. A1136]|uniref:hypothetical protein n=1 Tax=Streptomyces sp. A1136 TaxID=2563102 RepID=UPI00109EB11C|nr:hypothetical protein [Streptomyces sp. A1136]THA57505.1 hypothetical protein E6R62_06475 [Streptomyces sp. A1136]